MLRLIYTSSKEPYFSNDWQMHFCFVHLANIRPIEESSVKKDFKVPGIESLYKKGWAKWLDLDAPFSKEAVKEFLTTMMAMYEEDEQGNMKGVGVCGLVNVTKVEITMQGFNEYFECKVARPEHFGRGRQSHGYDRTHGGLWKDNNQGFVEAGFWPKVF